MSLKTKVTMKKGWDSTEWLEQGLAELAVDIHRRAVILAPKDTGNLANSGRVDRLSPTSYSISFGNKGRVPYARRRHFENKKNPHTKLYLYKAVDSVERSSKDKYFRNKKR